MTSPSASVTVADEPAAGRQPLSASRRRRLLWAWLALTVWCAWGAFWRGCERLASGGPPLLQPVCIDVNRATVAELSALPGIGRGRARAIVLHRVRHGPFSTAADLAAVDGLGVATVEGLRPWLLWPTTR